MLERKFLGSDAMTIGRNSTPPVVGRRRTAGLMFGVFLMAALIVVTGALLSRKSSAPAPADVSERDSGLQAEPPASEPTRPPAAARPVGIQPASEQPDAATARLIALLHDVGQPLKVRRQAARELARLGSNAAMAALKRALQDGPSQLRAGIAESLGESPHPDATRLLLDLLNSNDEAAVRGALRGFAARGDSDAVDVLGRTLFDGQKSEAVRTEAALALGGVNQPAALTSLTRAVTELGDETLVEHALEGLGKRPLAETREFLTGYLDTPNVPTEARVAAVEALSQAPDEVGSFLLKYIGDSDPEVRAAAAWALSAAENVGEVRDQLVARLKQESDATVRQRLYQALTSQEQPDVLAVLSLVQQERNPDTRLTGLQLVAGACRGDNAGAVATFFNETAVPELQGTALGSANPQQRLLAVMVLRRAGTPIAVEALQEIVRKSPDPKVVEAAQSVLRQRPQK